MDCIKQKTDSLEAKRKKLRNTKGVERRENPSFSNGRECGVLKKTMEWEEGGFCVHEAGGNDRVKGFRGFRQFYSKWLEGGVC